MSTNDKNGILRVEDRDLVSPLHPVFNALAQSVSDAFDKNSRIFKVADVAARTALVTSIGASNISNTNPLYVDRADAPAGRNLEVTRNGSTWDFIPTSNGSFSKYSTPAVGVFSGTLTWVKDSSGLVTVSGVISRSGSWNNTWESVATPPSNTLFPAHLVRDFAPTYAAANSFRLIFSQNTSGPLQVIIDPTGISSSGANPAYLSFSYLAANNAL